jgi:putative colanic acid biosynthesis UDP-glucose lipid carrier transferase
VGSDEADLSVSVSMPSDIALPPERSDAAVEQGRGVAISFIDRYALHRRGRSQITSKILAARIASFEFLGIVIAAIAAKWVYVDFYLGATQWMPSILALGLCLGCVVYVFYSELNLYDASAIGGPSLQVGKLLGGLTLSFLVLIGILYLLKLAEDFSRGWMLLWFALTVVIVCTVRSGALRYVRSLKSAHRMRERIAIVGKGNAAERLRSKLHRHADLEVVGVYDDPLDIEDQYAGSAGRGVSSLFEQARIGEVDQIIIALPKLEQAEVKRALRHLAILSIDLYLWTDATPILAPVLGWRNVGDLQLQLVAPKPLAEGGQLVKSGFDFVVALAALLLLAPVFALIALAVKADSPGPVFFRQRRFGRNRQIFSIYKFRTMTVMEDGPSIKQAEKNDVRVTRIGRFLRRNSLDELPQLLNVLKGEMSLVGPRPHALVHDKQYAPQIEHYTWRHRVKPGMTGWAQVNGLRGETKVNDDMRRRMEHDLHYIENWSVWLDFEILFRTVLTVLAKSAAY